MSLPFYSDWLSVKSADVHPVPAFSGFHQPGTRCQRSAVSRLPHLPQHPHGLCSGLHAPDSVPVLSGNCRSAAPRTLPHHDRRDHQRGTGLCTYRILRSWHCRSCPGYRTRPDGTGPGRTGLFSESEACSSSDSLHHAHKRTDPGLLQRFL